MEKTAKNIRIFSNPAESELGTSRLHV